MKECTCGWWDLKMPVDDKNWRWCPWCGRELVRQDRDCPTCDICQKLLVRKDGYYNDSPGGYEMWNCIDHGERRRA